LLYVDEIMITKNNKPKIRKVITELNSKFDTNDIEIVKILGIDIII